VGDDANPCSRTAPCKTFASAISKTAAGGEIDALDPGGFGALTITKAITIDGGGGQVASVLVAGTNGIVVAAGGSDVVILRNLRIDGISGTGNGGIDGVRFISGKALTVENCDIFGFSNNGIDIVAPGGHVFVDNTTSQNNGQSGLSIQSTTNTFVSIDHSRFELNNFGVFAGDFSRVTARNSVASGNNIIGFIAAPTAGTAELNLADCTAANNGAAGVQAGNGTTQATVRVSGVSIHGNPTGFAVGSVGTIVSFGNNHNSDGGAPTSTIGPQ
jgi:hypothetical protein